MKDLKKDDSIIIYPADNGKAFVIEARAMYFMKTQKINGLIDFCGDN